MNELFNFCVHVLYVGAHFCGITYQQINIWLFVIIHPLITLILFVLLIITLNKNRKLKNQIKTIPYEKK
jgi:hypothetical protein